MNALVIDLVTRTPWAERKNRFYFEADIPPVGLTDLENMANTVFAYISGLLAPMLTSQVSIMRAEARFYGAGGSEFEATTTVASVQGAISASTPTNPAVEEVDIIPDTLPDEVSLIIQKRTGNIGRSKRGRWFFTGLSERVQNAGIIAPDWKVTVLALADGLSNDITITGTGATTLHARHYDKFHGNLMPIVKCYAISTMGSRIDRRSPLRLGRLTA